jgi:hypothetical protein
MTCAALLGLAAGYGARDESALRTDPRGKEPARPGTFPRARDPGDDPVVRSGLKALGTTIDNPVGNKPGAKVPRITQQSGRIYYFLWSLERVAVIFDLNTIGDKDWYSWGAEVLLANQEEDGSWSNGEFREGNSDTCFALLFLRRANLAQDLTTSLKGRVKDPGKAELRSGGVGGAALAKGLKPILDPAGRVPDPEPKDDDETKANRWASALVEATGAKQNEALAKLRDTKGPEYTQALAVAIGQLGGPAKKKAREALADRMTRMTAATLAEKLKDEDLEVRRAAALACAMKDDKTNFARIIDLLEDPEVPVVRAAYAALKGLSGQDFGPAADASRAEKAEAVAKWKAWWKDQPKK